VYVAATGGGVGTGEINEFSRASVTGTLTLIGCIGDDTSASCTPTFLTGRRHAAIGHGERRWDERLRRRIRRKRDRRVLAQHLDRYGDVQRLLRRHDDDGGMPVRWG
jgi:hypothetical protein